MAGDNGLLRRFGRRNPHPDWTQPDTDGLILQDGKKRGIFLPIVWEQISEPREFLRHLKNKAGLPLDHWSDGVKVWRYTTESFGIKFGPAKDAPAPN